MLKMYKLIEEKLQTADKAEDACVFVYIAPTQEEQQLLTQTLKIDEHTLTSALDPEEPARLEFEPDHVAMILKRPKNYCAQERLTFRISSLGIFLFENKLVIVIPEDVSLFDGKLFQKITSVQTLFLLMMYRIIHHFLEHLRAINLMVEEVEKLVNKDTRNRYILDLFVLQKSLVYYVDAINSNAMLMEKIRINSSKIKISPSNMEILDDIIIENTQCAKTAEIYSNILSSVMDARASIVNNNLNILMKNLSVVALCFVIPTYITSLFSMNVPIPLHENNAAFPIIITLSLLPIPIIYFLVKKNKI